jgi:hypothetical protein
MMFSTGELSPCRNAYPIRRGGHGARRHCGVRRVIATWEYSSLNTRNTIKVQKSIQPRVRHANMKPRYWYRQRWNCMILSKDYLKWTHKYQNTVNLSREVLALRCWRSNWQPRPSNDLSSLPVYDLDPST